MLDTHGGRSLRSKDVTEPLEQIAEQRGCPAVPKTDYGGEFAGRVIDRWTYENEAEMDFSRPGKPRGNATVESFNSSLRAGGLNAKWLLSLADARVKAEQWRVFYNQVCGHSAIEWLTPAEYPTQNGEWPIGRV